MDHKIFLVSRFLLCTSRVVTAGLRWSVLSCEPAAGWEGLCHSVGPHAATYSGSSRTLPPGVLALLSGPGAKQHGLQHLWVGNIQSPRRIPKASLKTTSINEVLENVEVISVSFETSWCIYVSPVFDLTFHVRRGFESCPFLPQDVSHGKCPCDQYCHHSATRDRRKHSSPRERR